MRTSIKQISRAHPRTGIFAQPFTSYMRRLLFYFLRGLALVAPIAITAWVCVRIFATIDGWLGLPVRGLGFLATIALITGAGFLASNLVTRWLFARLEHVLERLPFVRLLYGSTRDLLNAFVGEKRRFDVPVIVRLVPDGAVHVLGFVTQGSLGSIGLPSHVAVYVPQSYNFAGNVIVVPSDHVARLDVDSAGVMAFIVSGGVSALPAPVMRTVAERPAV